MTPDPDSSGSTGGTRAHFDATLWNVVLTARDGGTAEAQEALGKLCEIYWYPLYAFIRRRGKSPHDAEELTQDFFHHLLSNDILQKVERQGGRFRSFLLASLTNFLNNVYAKEHAQKRRPVNGFVPLDASSGENRYRMEAADNASPEKIYERSWAVTLLEQIVERLRLEENAAGRENRFALLQPQLTAADDAPNYRELAQALSLTEAAVRMAVHRLRQRYGQLLREEIAQTVSSPEEVDDEIRHLFAVLAG